jgi:tight adherence protein C
MSGTMIDLLLLFVLLAAVTVFFVMRPGSAAAGPSGYFIGLATPAGFDPVRLRPLYWVGKIALALMLPLVAYEFWAWLPWSALALLALTGFFMPDLWLLLRRRSRQRRILQSLSFFLDLLVSLLQSGLDLPEAFRRAGVHGLKREHPLADEVKLVSDEIAAGKDHAAAFGALAARTRLPDLHTIASALALSSRLGFPVAETLAVQAEIQRERRVDRGRKRIDRAMMIALVPVLLCGIPLFLMVVVLPVVLDIFRTLDLVRNIGL